jgi:tRNA(fMet)-specific endonuclease VapC
MALLIDSDLLIDLERSVGTQTVSELLGDEECAISVITVSELLHGVLRATGERRTRRRAFVEHLFAGIQAIPITEPVARVHAEIWSELTERGQAIGAHELWIAATAAAHGLGVATRNVSDFQRVAGLRVVAPS